MTHVFRSIGRAGGLMSKTKEIQIDSKYDRDRLQSETSLTATKKINAVGIAYKMYKAGCREKQILLMLTKCIGVSLDRAKIILIEMKTYN